MKKIAFIVVSALMMTFAVQAQHVFDKGDIGINAGLGIGSYGGFFPSIEASVEFGVIPTGDIGLVSFGGVLGYKYSRYTYDYVFYNDSYNYSQLIFGGRGTWHLHSFTSDKWDAYAGLGLGLHMYSDYDYDYHNGNYESNKIAKSNVYTEIFVGGRMMFKPKMGLFAEVGYSKLSTIRAGLTFLL